MARKTEDIELDIAEVKQLVLTAKRPTNQAILAKHLSSLKSQLQNLAPPKIQTPSTTTTATSQEKPKAQTQSKNQQQPQKVQAPKTETDSNQKNINYTPLTKYSWDQQGKKVKLYFTLDGIGNECKANQIDIKFQKQSVQMKIRDYKKGNYIFAIRKLCGPIQTQTCTYLVKTNTISITLIKKQSGHWPQIQYKQDTFKQKKQEKEDNPGDSIMKMMKKMYDQGDENMKRTIAQAWTKAQDKKGGADDLGMPKFGDMGDFGGMGGLGGMGGFGKKK